MNATNRRDIQCQYCGGDRFALLFDNVTDRLRHVEGKWKFHQCEECGSAQLDPLPSREQIAQAYPEVYTPSPAEDGAGGLPALLKSIEHRMFFKPIYQRQVRKIIERANFNESGSRSVLDIGCGKGLRLIEFANHGCDVLGVDFQESTVDFLNSLGIRAIVGDLGALAAKLEPERFDIVTACYCLEHAYDVGEVLRSCYELLKPGGWMVAACPLVDSLQARMFGRRWSQVTEAPRHITIPSRKGVETALARAGFAPQQMIPDSARWCAGMAAQSLLPGSATTFAYSSSRVAPWIVRIAAAMLSIGWVPLSVAENYLVGRPGCGIFLSQKMAV